MIEPEPSELIPKPAGGADGQGVSFSLSRVSKLVTKARGLAAKKRASEASLPGWDLNHEDPESLLAGFPSLSLKSGHRLISYLYSDGANASSELWAVPSDRFDAAQALAWGAPGPDGPAPVGGSRRYMQSITGDNTAWSYLQASLFAREAAELGAAWHGVDWQDHVLLGGPLASATGETEEAEQALEEALSGAADWDWGGPAVSSDQDWQPRVTVSESGVTVVFHTYTAHVRQRIQRHTDRYAPGSYDFESETEVLAAGSRGFIY